MDQSSRDIGKTEIGKNWEKIENLGKSCTPSWLEQVTALTITHGLSLSSNGSRLAENAHPEGCCNVAARLVRELHRAPHKSKSAEAQTKANVRVIVRVMAGC